MDLQKELEEMGRRLIGNGVPRDFVAANELACEVGALMFRAAEYIAELERPVVYDSEPTRPEY
jgi:hypothetical protein